MQLWVDSRDFRVTGPYEHSASATAPIFIPELVTIPYMQQRYYQYLDVGERSHQGQSFSIFTVLKTWISDHFRTTINVGVVCMGYPLGRENVSLLFKYRKITLLIWRTISLSFKIRKTFFLLCLTIPMHLVYPCVPFMCIPKYHSCIFLSGNFENLYLSKRKLCNPCPRFWMQITQCHNLDLSDSSWTTPMSFRTISRLAPYTKELCMLRFYWLQMFGFVLLKKISIAKGFMFLETIQASLTL